VKQCAAPSTQPAAMSAAQIESQSRRRSTPLRFQDKNGSASADSACSTPPARLRAERSRPAATAWASEKSAAARSNARARRWNS
jgi:hypothetical protein